MINAIAVTATGLLGLLIGSFVGVLIDRVPAGRSIIRPPSACTSCGRRIRPLDNMPVVSWLLLGGRCRDCDEPIPIRYPVIELATGFLFGLAAVLLGIDWLLPAYLWFFAVTLSLLVIDIFHQRIPNAILLPGLIGGAVLLTLGALLESRFDALWRGFAGGAIAFVVFLVLALATRGGFGMGDVKLAAFVGLKTAFASWVALGGAVLGSFVIGGVTAVILLMLGRKGRKDRVAYGPFLIVASWLVILMEPLMATGERFLGG